MADLEPQVCAILEIMVNAAVSEMNKVIGASDPPRPQETSCVAEDTHGSPEDKVQDKVQGGLRSSGIRAGSGPRIGPGFSRADASSNCRPDNRPSIEIEELAVSSG